eukprot:scaffold6270_cov162-Amphora_coffeaeformis.AAC.6
MVYCRVYCTRQYHSSQKIVFFVGALEFHDANVVCVYSSIALLLERMTILLRNKNLFGANAIHRHGHRCVCSCRSRPRVGSSTKKLVMMTDYYPNIAHAFPHIKLMPLVRFLLPFRANNKSLGVQQCGSCSVVASSFQHPSSPFSATAF